jgi:hypothetical protein
VLAESLRLANHEKREQETILATIKAVILDVDGAVAPVDLDGGYEALQAAVGGNFDLVTSSTGETSFWLHDEGKLIGLPVNATATRLLWKLNPAFDGLDVLVGTVVVTGGADDEGETLGVGDEALAALGLKHGS